jgi:hypothetical protein
VYQAIQRRSISRVVQQRHETEVHVQLLMATAGLNRDRIGEIIGSLARGLRHGNKITPNFVHIRDGVSRDENTNLRAFEEEDFGRECANFGLTSNGPSYSVSR